jgi:hypothetical protein
MAKADFRPLAVLPWLGGRRRRRFARTALSAEEPFVNVSSAAELLSHLEFAASALKRSVSRSRERDETKIALNYD